MDEPVLIRFATKPADAYSPQPDQNGKRPSLGSDADAWMLHSEVRTTRTYGGPLSVSDVVGTLRRCCWLRTWQRRLPISLWIRKYSWKDLKGDFIAGVTVGLTVIPQALAYSAIAELPLEYGLYSAFMGCFMYTLFGTSKDVTLGPTAIISLLTAESFPKNAGLSKPQYAIFLCFFTGVFQCLMAIFNLGFLINFVSAPVISGFTSASAFIIMYGQLKSILGVSFGKSTDGVLEQTAGYLNTIWNINGWDVLMGVSCMAILLVLKGLRLPRRHGQKSKSPLYTYARETLRLISVARYGIVVIVAAGIGYFLEEYFPILHSVTLTKDVEAGLPNFTVPEFSFNNQTFREVFVDMTPGIAVVSLVGAMESIAIAKAFAHQFQYNIDPTQEFLALGMANFLSSFVSSYPVTGSFTKSALNAQSGVRTPMGCVFTGAFVLGSLSLLSSSFRYVPKAALGAVIICAVSVMFEFKIFRDLWLLNKKELIPLIMTIAVGVIFGVDFGLLAGIIGALLLLLYPLARPAIDVEHLTKTYTPAPITYTDITSGRQILEVTVTPHGALYFPSGEYIKEFFEEDIFPQNGLEKMRVTDADGADAISPVLLPEGLVCSVDEVIVFNGIHLINSDYTTLRALRAIVMKCRKACKTLKFINTPMKILRIVLPKEVREQVKWPDKEEGQAIVVNFSQSLPEKLASVSLNVEDGESRRGSSEDNRREGEESMVVASSTAQLEVTSKSLP
ncbi:sodium-independent sulfate anion transporter-like [Paramacrobiotus metropolitanus]|uniref:sodium-independent sulfate anion transporter-like n=1 Tax=Paramacrobiotus metropolitanus TaxID=2943436 RepID=UPI00244580A0|nr:sodium-independent sulfate anion transporter-like [Paramacrobiotus metropolitanus]